MDISVQIIFATAQDLCFSNTYLVAKPRWSRAAFVQSRNDLDVVLENTCTTHVWIYNTLSSIQRILIPRYTIPKTQVCDEMACIEALCLRREKLMNEATVH